MSRGEADLVASIRHELAAIRPARTCCIQAELDALADSGRRVEVSLARTVYELTTELTQRGVVRTRGGLPRAHAEERAAAFAKSGSGRHCRLSFLRGRFLARGSLSLASGSVHLEINVSGGEATHLARIAEVEELGGHRRERRGKGLLVINQVDLEEYVKGVVPAEVNSAWHTEMLKVQAVAARTYALYQHMLSASRDYDVAASIQDQVYRGRQGVDARVQEAVESTRGLVVTHEGAPIYAAFSSTAAGITEDAMVVWSKDLPYLKGVECPFDVESPYYQWKASFKLATLERNLRNQGFSLGTIATMTPVGFSRAGRVAKLRILHSKGELIVRDDGVGLPLDFNDQHFSGLGLKILRVFAGQLGGEVLVTGAPEQGATFRLRFPAVPPAV